MQNAIIRMTRPSRIILPEVIENLNIIEIDNRLKKADPTMKVPRLYAEAAKVWEIGEITLAWFPKAYDHFCAKLQRRKPGGRVEWSIEYRLHYPDQVEKLGPWRIVKFHGDPAQAERDIAIMMLTI